MNDVPEEGVPGRSFGRVSSDHEPALTVVVIPSGGRGSRTLVFSDRSVRWLRRGAVAGCALFVVLAASWIYLAVRTRQVAALEAQLEELTVRESRVADLARDLEQVEDAYERIRRLFGIDGDLAGAAVGDVWLPPANAAASPGSMDAGAEIRIPQSWPLTERGFVTRSLLDGGAAEHSGIDIAIPSGSYVRASGSGVIAELGEDEIYGHYIVIEHADGYRTLYAHNTLVIPAVGATVRANEVIALSGSSGQSTAPHLHFEVTRNGEPIDPLTLVAQP